VRSSDKRKVLRAATATLSLVVVAAFVASAAGRSATSTVARATGRALSVDGGRRAGLAGAVPTLGRKWAPSQSGYGSVKPAKINNGGDPTGILWRVRWTRWGQRRAVGAGIGYFVWPGLGVADGSIRARAVLIAYDLGSCRGKLAYRKIEWFYPNYGGEFIPEDYTNICSGGGGAGLPTRTCRGVMFRSPAGVARRIETSGLSCRRARALVANSPSLRYLHRGGRFRYASLFCGSEGDVLVGEPALFECARGRIDLLYELSRR
jgi:hypothetical protein